MRHIYNGGSSDTSGSFDKDEAWSEVMEAGTEAGAVAEGVAERGQRWVKTDPLTMLPDTMCVDLSLTSLLACLHPPCRPLSSTSPACISKMLAHFFIHLKHFICWLLLQLSASVVIYVFAGRNCSNTVEFLKY